jgi:hypothetical protein
MVEKNEYEAFYKCPHIEKQGYFLAFPFFPWKVFEVGQAVDSCYG